jgi:hypothetical protein
MRYLKPKSKTRKRPPRRKTRKRPPRRKTHKKPPIIKPSNCLRERFDGSVPGTPLPDASDLTNAADGGLDGWHDLKTLSGDPVLRTYR